LLFHLQSDKNVEQSDSPEQIPFPGQTEQSVTAAAFLAVTAAITTSNPNSRYRINFFMKSVLFISNTLAASYPY
jgi:hypothetical protein